MASNSRQSKKIIGMVLIILGVVLVVVLLFVFAGKNKNTQTTTDSSRQNQKEQMDEDVSEDIMEGHLNDVYDDGHSVLNGKMLIDGAYYGVHNGEVADEKDPLAIGTLIKIQLEENTLYLEGSLGEVAPNGELNPGIKVPNGNYAFPVAEDLVIHGYVYGVEPVEEITYTMSEFNKLWNSGQPSGLGLEITVKDSKIVEIEPIS